MGHGINYLALFVAAAAAWIFGAVYYTVLGDAWIMAQNLTRDDVKTAGASRSIAAKAAPFILSFIAELVMAGVLFGILFHMSLFTPRDGAISGALCWLGFVLTTIAVNNTYTFRRHKLTLIDAGHWLGVLVIMGAILGWFGA